MAAFRTNAVEPVFLIIASNTQFVERIIKEAALCSSTGQQEMMRTVYPIVRSRFIHFPKPDVEEEVDEDESESEEEGEEDDGINMGILPDNAEDDPMVGDDAAKDDQEEAEDDSKPVAVPKKSKSRPTEKAKAKSLIAEVFQRFDRLETMKSNEGEDTFMDMRKDIKAEFTDKSKWHQTERTEDFLVSFKLNGVAGDPKP